MLIDRNEPTDDIVARPSALIESGLSLDRAKDELHAQRCGQSHLYAALARAFGLSARKAAGSIARHSTAAAQEPSP